MHSPPSHTCKPPNAGYGTYDHGVLEAWYVWHDLLQRTRPIKIHLVISVSEWYVDFAQWVQCWMNASTEVRDIVRCKVQSIEVIQNNHLRVHERKEKQHLTRS